MFAICESPQGYASAAFSAHNQGEEIWMSLLRTSHGAEKEEEGSSGGGGDAITGQKERGRGWGAWRVGGFGRWGCGGRNGGRLQGSPAPRQMCLGVTPHPQRNESANRCLTSRPACHASHTRTHTHTHSNARMHVHTQRTIRGVRPRR